MVSKVLVRISKPCEFCVVTGILVCFGNASVKTSAWKPQDFVGTLSFLYTDSYVLLGKRYNVLVNQSIT